MYNMKDKDNAIEEYMRHIQLLKNALRKAPAGSFRTAISATSVKVEE